MKKKQFFINIGKHTLNLLIILAGIGLHLVSIWVLYRAFLPIAKWYWEAMPVRGVDLTNAATYVAYLKENFALLPFSWKYIFFNGEPLVIDYPSLHFYFSLPFLRWFTPIRSMQLWMLVSTFLYFVFSYLLYARLSKSRWLALFLGILTIYSVNVYGALIWGGSIPYHGTQFLLPLTLYFLVCYFKTGKQRWFAGAILALGISQYGHPQVALSYGIALSVLSLLLAPRVKHADIKKRFVDVFIFLFLMLLIGLPSTLPRLGALLRVPALISRGLSGELPVSYQATVGHGVAEEIRRFYETRIYLFFTDTHQWMFWVGGALLAVYLLVYFSFTFIRVVAHRKKSRNVSIYTLLWATLLLGYVASYIYIYSRGMDIFHGGWYRVFWPVPMVVGMFAAVVMGGILDVTVGERRDNFFRLIWLFVDLIFIALVFVLLPSQYTPDFEESLYIKSAASGGFPGNVIAAVTESEQEEFSQVALPPWLPGNSRDYRLYSANQVYNMWFNSYFDIPLARGYIDPSITDVQRWGIFLMDIVIDSNVAIEKFEYPEEMAKNAARFVLDWNAIRYLAGETTGSGSSYFTPFSAYLLADEFITKDETWETIGARSPQPRSLTGDKYDPDVSNWVRYLEVREDLVSPILSLTNSPSILFIGDEPFWEIFIRSLAQLGMTSKDLIPVKGPKLLNRVSLDELEQFDAVMLYGYDYKNHGKTWGAVERYVEKGGRLFVETGAEVKESASMQLPPPFPKELPSVFPIAKTFRGDLGKEWSVSYADELSGIDFPAFSPLLYDEDPWNVSYSEIEDVDEDADLLLSLADKPILVSWQFGEGNVVWSGLNLPAHMERNRNMAEADLLRDLLELVVLDLDGERAVVSSEAEFISAEKRKVVGSGAKSVLFKESNFPGWSARLKSDGRREKLKIWRTGLGYPGVMWAKIPDKLQAKPLEVEFVYRGSLFMWMQIASSSLVGVVLFDSFLFNGRVFGASVSKIWTAIKKRVGAWWEKEEEE